MSDEESEPCLPLLCPQLHDNGTPPDELLLSIELAYHALDDGLTALKKTAPNPRDYGSMAYEFAVKQHDSRMRAVYQVMEQIESISNTITAQVNEKKAKP